MDGGIISRRYAKALIQYAASKKKLDTVYNECEMLVYACRDVKDFSSTLANPIVSKEDKMLLLKTAVNGTGFSDILSRFIALVFKNHREEYLGFICVSYIELYRNKKHLGIVTLTTAVPIEDKVRDEIVFASHRRLHAKIELRTEVDPSIIGGFIYDIDFYRLDASIRSQLKAVRIQFVEKNRRIV
ncbi:MAG: F0F1 ATP synthase subunit delta [Bacteroidales bacterium]